MAKQLDFRPDRTANLDRQLRGAFREIASGKSGSMTQVKGDVRRLSSERGTIITSRNLRDTSSTKK